MDYEEIENKDGVKIVKSLRIDHTETEKAALLTKKIGEVVKYRTDIFDTGPDQWYEIKTGIFRRIRIEPSMSWIIVFNEADLPLARKVAESIKELGYAKEVTIEI